MSFGFGFALPAYQLRGGGGNNPFNQNGPTLDLSFAGTVTDASNPNGYTLNTNFITPQYQIAAQYVIWETGVGLVDKTFSQIITFSRASGATWFNSAGNLIGVDFSTSSNTIGTGSKTFTLDATAGVNRSWATGDSVLIVDQANSANNMTGAVTSYTASTQTLVVNVTSTAGSGTITSWRIGNLMQRLDYNPATLAAQGLLIEEQRTNSIRNNTMQGAVAGTPGTVPTNWDIVVSGTGITQQIIGTGTEDGITYIDIKFSGTGSSTPAPQIRPETTTQIVAASGQTWSSSYYLRIVNGSTTGCTGTFQQVWQERDAAGVALNTVVVGIADPTNAALRTQRSVLIRTLTDAGTARLTNRIQWSFTNGVAVDITLRIGLPQLEQGAFATSVIPTTTTALTRSADVASVNTLSPWFNATAGTLFVQGILVGGTASTFPRMSTLAGSNPNNDDMGVVWGANAGSMRWSVRAGGATQADVTFSLPKSAGASFKVAGRYAANDFQAAFDGNLGVPDTTGTLPTITSLSLGGPASFQPGANVWLQRVTFYPRGLSNAELVSITS